MTYIKCNKSQVIYFKYLEEAVARLSLEMSVDLMQVNIFVLFSLQLTSYFYLDLSCIVQVDGRLLANILGIV